MVRLPIVLTPTLLIVVVGSLPVVLLLAIVVAILLAEVFLAVHYELRFQNGVGHDPPHAASCAIGQQFVLRYHACSLVGKKVSLITFDVGHVVTAICVGTLIAQMVAVISASITVEKIVKSFQDVAM